MLVVTTGVILMDRVCLWNVRSRVIRLRTIIGDYSRICGKYDVLEAGGGEAFGN